MPLIWVKSPVPRSIKGYNAGAIDLSGALASGRLGAAPPLLSAS